MISAARLGVCVEYYIKSADHGASVRTQRDMVLEFRE